MIDRVLQTILFARDSPELKVCISLVIRNFYSSFEALDRFRVLPAVLVDQSQLVMSAGVARINSCCFHRTTKALALPQGETNITQVPAKHSVCVVQKER